MNSLGDKVIGQTCPRCKKESIVYDGNYFCSVCPWIMGEAGRPKRIIIAYLVQRYQEAEADGNEDVMEIFANYLSRYL